MTDQELPTLGLVGLTLVLLVVLLTQPLEWVWRLSDAIKGRG